ncbi:Hypothetical protein EPM1_2936 [Stenotrophomonas maltophilia EPM1]|nr:Hypothetical protein EPM1_2936 [Stenotrophomonas maltophilia EPM1]
MRYRPVPTRLKCDAHHITVSFSDVKEMFHRTNVSIWNERRPSTENLNVTIVVT